MNATLVERYAELIVRVGANIQPGQRVFVNAAVEHLEVARAVAEKAYEAGALRVHVEFRDDQIRLAALRFAPDAGLTDATGWEFERVRSLRDGNSAMITLTGSADPHIFDGIDPHRLASRPLELAKESVDVILGGDLAWTIVAAPNAGWANQVFGEPDVDRLWDAIAGPLRLDELDVVGAWEAHRDELQRRAAAVTALGLDAVRYRGEGTDLTVGLIAGAQWTGGSLTTTKGIVTMPNLPTEEVFTSPDRRRADGHLTLTRPLVMPRTGAFVDGLRVSIEDGRIVDARAETGGDAVTAELDTDDGARSLGEVSLVDRHSRVNAAGIVFHDTLYDENAGAHVAWGNSFPFTLDGWRDRSPEELVDAGLNQSVVHTDVVIGGPGVDVEGIRPDGTVVPIITDNTWVLPG